MWQKEVVSPSLHFQAGKSELPWVLLIEKANDDVANFVDPKYSSTSINAMHAVHGSPDVVLLEITTQLLPTGHKEVQTKLAPDPEEVYPGKHVQDEADHAPALDDELDGQPAHEPVK